MDFWNAYWFKYLKNFLIGVGAAFIIIGALFKILHWEGADDILMYAMMGEALIFLIQGLLPPEKEYKWERAYPQLMDKSIKVKPGKKTQTGTGLAAKLDGALANAKVDDELINSLGTHIRNLGDNIGKLTSVTDSAAATEEYAKNAKQAAAALGNISGAYTNAAGMAEGLSKAMQDSQAYYDQVKLASENLAKLNAVYQLELQDSNNHLRAVNEFQKNMTAVLGELSGSLDDTRAYKNGMAQLNKNLSSLNNIYGNMLSAMAGGPRK